MHTITIKDFRCFGEMQTARLAPLTLLVGENSTGKTSFLALLRALDDLAHNAVPDFKWPPYDLGTFDEIAHYRGGRGSRAETFCVGVAITSSASADSQDDWRLVVEFGKKQDGTEPVPVFQHVSLGKMDEKGNCEGHRIEVDFRAPYISLKTKEGRSWEGTWNVSKGDTWHDNIISFLDILFSLFYAGGTGYKSINVSQIEGDSYDLIRKDIDWQVFMDEIFAMRQLPYVFASAPVRSQPRRTYDPARPVVDPEGNYVPMLLAKLSSQQPEVWTELKQDLENFGQSSGLFDEIRIRHFGKSDSNPFQVQVKKSGKRGTKGPWRNLIDVGHGVSQALPIITELLRGDVDQQSPETSRPRQFLLQQPEVHLHPSAQAALGSLFCQMAGPRRQLIVETHSDHLMDRVRMDVRDGVSGLKPEDVSILFFERRGLDVRIHSLRIDKEGNVLDAPEGYRQFFMDEMSRSLWPERSGVEA